MNPREVKTYGRMPLHLRVYKQLTSAYRHYTRRGYKLVGMVYGKETRKEMQRFTGGLDV